MAVALASELFAPAGPLIDTRCPSWNAPALMPPAVRLILPLLVLLLALLLVRFIVPVAALASEYAFQAFMADQYQVHQQGIEQAAESFGALPVAEEAAKARWWEVRERIDELKASAERIVDHTIRIAVVFLLQTLVLPFLVMWGMLQAVRLLSSPTGARSQGPEGCQHGQLVSMPRADYGVAPRGDGKQ